PQPPRSLSPEARARPPNLSAPPQLALWGRGCGRAGRRSSLVRPRIGGRGGAGQGTWCGTDAVAAGRNV
ncbi:hypothetical protein MC885_002969, partial [Smutsia gigantea]